MSESVIVVDFGGQYNQLIARRVRDLRVYSEIVPCDITADEVRELAPAAIILSGGPASVYAEDAPSIDPGIFELDIPVLGFVENYSYYRCPDCGKEHAIFGQSNIEALAGPLDIPVLAKLPINPEVARAMDEGRIESYEPNPLAGVAQELDEKLGEA